MILSRADALTLHLGVEDFAILFGGDLLTIFKLFLKVLSKSITRFRKSLMRTEISPAVSIISENVLEDLVTFFLLKFKEWQWQ